MAISKKKIVALATTAALSGSLLLGGTYAWQSINQTALNEASDVINPGGRLHDDFYIDDNGDYNADIYVENFADDEIYARVKLQEYMEVVINQGVAGAEIVDTVVGEKYLDDNPVDAATDNVSGYEYSYVTHYFDQANATDEYWDWTMGGSASADVYYMPTFNMNKDSLVADRNGMYVDRIGGISNRSQAQYDEWYVWTENEEKTGTEIWDSDPNTADEVGYDFDNLDTYLDAGNIATVDETHIAALVGRGNGLISMAEWIDKYNSSENTADYWVYDTDGWIYWSSPIAAKSTTGLLLDAIDLKQVMDDTWYYAINVIAQFITADDLGYADSTGFYDSSVSPGVTADALTLLETIGVDVGNAADSIPQTLDLYLNYNENSSVSARRIDTISVGVEPGSENATALDPTVTEGSDEYWAANISGIMLYGVGDGENYEIDSTGYSYSYDSETNTGTLTISDTQYDRYIVRDLSGQIAGTVDFGSGSTGEDTWEDVPYYISVYVWDGTAHAAYVALDTTYTLEASAPSNFNETDSDMSFTLTVKDQEGNISELTADKYTIVDADIQARDDGSGEIEYVIRNDFKLNPGNEDLYGKWLVVEAKPDVSSGITGSHEVIINENSSVLDIRLYEEASNTLVTGTYLTPGTYDIVVSCPDDTGNSYVVYSTDETIAPVDSRLYDYQQSADGPIIVYDYYGGTSVNESGQLVFAEDSGLTDTIAVGVRFHDLIITKDDGSTFRTYGYGQTDNLYQLDTAGLTLLIDGEEQNILQPDSMVKLTAADQGTAVDMTGAEYIVSGNNSASTYAQHAIDHGILYIGADETAEQLTITVHTTSGTATHVVNIDHAVAYTVTQATSVTYITVDKTKDAKITLVSADDAETPVKLSECTVELVDTSVYYASAGYDYTLDDDYTLRFTVRQMEPYSTARVRYDGTMIFRITFTEGTAA